ncbi:hypothetical protein UlMin_014022 [Ulmus minor]
MKKTELVLIPFPGKSHLVSFIEFAKHLVSREDRFSVTIMGIKSPFEPITNSTTSSSISILHPNIKYFDVEPIDPPPFDLLHTARENYLTLFVQSHCSPIKQIIIDHVLTKPVFFAGVVVDLLTTSLIDLADELRVPSYVYFTSGAGFVGFSFYVLSQHEQDGLTKFNESDSDSNIPSFANPVPAGVFPSIAFHEQGFMWLVEMARRSKKTKGIIFNTVLELEFHSLNSFSDGETPPFYTVGPLLDLKGEGQEQSFDKTQRRNQIVTWLDDQPLKSVVFLCFGTNGTFGAAQLREIAIGLDRSGQRFLWSVRKAQHQNRYAPLDEYTDDELVEILPEGFLERTKERGMICGWAPQAEVLAHKATGGFVSHCGWNSTLESLWFGVPIVTWPLYAEQQMNAFQMVRDLGLAVELRLDFRRDKEEVVVADEIEKAVRSVMEGDCERRKKVEEMSQNCRGALENGGSSCESFGKLIEAMFAKHLVKSVTL